MRRLFLWLAIILGVSAMLTASTQAQPPPQTSVVLPAAPKAAPRQTPAPVFTPPPRTPDPTLDLPDDDTTKRVTGLGQEAVGGADCRAECDKAYYMCLSTDDGGQCPPTWSQCLTACPAVSSNF
jgi:hypothetical protein